MAPTASYQALKKAAQKVKSSTSKKAPKASAAQKTQARKARAGARIANGKKPVTKKSKATTSKTSAPVVVNHASDLAGVGGVNFFAADYITGDIWTPNPMIPAIDEATYESQLTQAQGQGRSIEVASQNLKNINGLTQA